MLTKKVIYQMIFISNQLIKAKIIKYYKDIKIGKNGKEIICPKDNTIIYKIHNDNGETTCPTCNLVIYNCIF